MIGWMVECDDGWTTGRPGKDALLVPCTGLDGSAQVASCSSCIGYPFDPFSENTYRSLVSYLEDCQLQVFYEG